MSWSMSLRRVGGEGDRLPQKGPDSAPELRNAAQQFEALLIGTMLRQAREAALGLGSDAQDGATQTALEMAEERLAEVMASQGGLGLAALLIRGLQGPEVKGQYRGDPYPEYAVSRAARGSEHTLPDGPLGSAANPLVFSDTHASQPSSNVRRRREASASRSSLGCT